MIKTVAEMATENSTVENLTTPSLKTQENDVNYTASINALPVTAILLAMVASCNSGKNIRYVVYVYAYVTAISM